jgi:hypothetical protein
MHQKPLDVTEPELIGLQQDELDALAFSLLGCERGAYVIADQDDQAHRLTVYWHLLATNPGRIRLADDFNDEDTLILLREVSNEDDHLPHVYLWEDDLGFLYAKLSPDVVTRMGMRVVDPHATYKARLVSTNKAILRHEMAQRANNRLTVLSDSVDDLKG